MLSYTTVIVTFNRKKSVYQALLRQLKQTAQAKKIIVVDNASTDDTVAYLKEKKDIKTIFNSENVGFPKGCNMGIQLASKDNDILLLNNDTIVTTNWLKNLKICLESDEKIGAVGAISNNNDNLQGCDFLIYFFITDFKYSTSSSTFNLIKIGSPFSITFISFKVSY